MKNNRFKKISAFSIVLCLIVTMLSSFTAYAESANSSNIIGEVNSYIPYISFEIKDKDLQESDISAKLGSEELRYASIDNLDSQKSVTYIAIDNSKSMTQDNISPKNSFDELKSGINAIIEDNASEDHKIVAYSIGEGDPKNIGEANDADSAKALASAVNALKGNEDATNLNEALEKIYYDAVKNLDEYTLVKLILVTDTSGDYGAGVDLSETEDLFRYNQIPVYTVVNSIKENSDYFKELRSFSRNSGGEGYAFFYNDNQKAKTLLNKVYADMYTGKYVTFITSTAADKNTRELTVTIKGNPSSETVRLDREANIDADVVASVEVKDNNAFVFTFSQDGFNGNLPLNDAALKIDSYTITKAGKDKPFAIREVNRDPDGKYVVTMKDEIYTGAYDFNFNAIEDLSRNKNQVQPLLNQEIEAKNNFWKFFPYIIVFVVILVVLLAFYLILLNIKKKKNVKTIREIFVSQVEETTVEEKVYVQNPPVKQNGAKVNLYTKTGNNPQKNFSLNVVSSFIVGRSDICDVCINDSKMSRQHFAVEHTQGVYMITDLESANGTFVNGIRVRSRQRLNSGDMIVCGITSIRIEF